MEESQIAQIFRKELNQQVISVIDKSKGVDQEVKIIQTNKDKYVLKNPHKEQDKILKEIVATQLCSEKNIPVPRVIYSTENLLIESCIEGVDLDDLEASKEHFKNIYFQIGKLTKLMHSIQGQKFGSVNQNQLIGDSESQEEAILSWIPSEIERLEKLNYYSSEQINKIKEYFENNKSILNTHESVLLHSDITDSNIVIKDNEVSGFIDFGDLSVGPAMQDFAFMYIDHFGDFKFDKLLEGYGEHNFEEMKFYAFCWMCWLVGSKIEKKEFDEKFERMKNLFADIWC
ncbi:MAG: aminoglycoside phosphotransferase family protein [Candidatus Woesearchaeota archaeon]